MTTECSFEDMPSGGETQPSDLQLEFSCGIITDRERQMWFLELENRTRFSDQTAEGTPWSSVIV